MICEGVSTSEFYFSTKENLSQDLVEIKRLGISGPTLGSVIPTYFLLKELVHSFP